MSIRELELGSHDGLWQGSSPVLFVCLWTEFLGLARCSSESSSRTTGFHLCFLQMMLTFWLHYTMTFTTLKHINIKQHDFVAFQGCHLFTSEGKMEPEIDRWIWCSLISVVVKKELKNKALDLLVGLQSHSSLCSSTLGSDQKHKSVDASGQNKFQVAGHSLSDRVRSSVTWEWSCCSFTTKRFS